MSTQVRTEAAQGTDVFVEDPMEKSDTSITSRVTRHHAIVGAEKGAPFFPLLHDIVL